MRSKRFSGKRKLQQGAELDLGYMDCAVRKVLLAEGRNQHCMGSFAAKDAKIWNILSRKQHTVAQMGQ
jgi:hypothetical protein